MGALYGHHKSSDEDLVNSINYMSHGYIGFVSHAFLGFIPIVLDDYHFGVNIGDKNYTACHVFLSPDGWGDSCTDQIKKVKPWVLMFMGIDDISYYTRFRTEQDAVDYFNNIEVYNQQVHNRSFWQN